ncbi:uncharacterized protein F5891DRAFT_1281532 [Suillus fuscotomentosus]|uniref:Uncharacterized protein n=1 Tax=Suillus fuscotomentosus TaxID=1912939 RepID=A0AAD4HEH0_9AGAM|nr:uncharacterized protein F5891DRAFT_1281532 [Suillus fuscotomentosus]KAG1894630.1 hypothetical protein F5891DRAFT_1281532 [Suillus fuscotomentosus]
MALEYGATPVWGPEMVDKAILHAEREIDPVTGVISYNGKSRAMFTTHPLEKPYSIYQIGSADPKLTALTSTVGVQNPSALTPSTICGLVKAFIPRAVTCIHVGEAAISSELAKKILLCTRSNAAIDEIAKEGYRGSRQKRKQDLKMVIIDEADQMLTRNHVIRTSWQLLRTSVLLHPQVHFTTTAHRTMGKNNKKKSNIIPAEAFLRLPPLADASLADQPIIDTHTHLVSTFSTYRNKYRNGTLYTIHDFVREMYRNRNVRAIVDVWCEAPVLMAWRELADSALTAEDREQKWGGIDYWFVMGVHPHDAKSYNDAVEASILEAMAHPRCVGWGEMGLDYHYDNSPRTIQQEVFIRQLNHAVRLGKPLTIHTREAEADTERILMEHCPCQSQGTASDHSCY